MQRHLVDFSRSKENLFLVQGKPGTGKSFLSEWIVERLQRSEGRSVHHDTIYFSIEKDVCTQTSTMALAKSILLQLLDRNVGNMSLYTAVCDVVTTSSKAKSTDEIEQIVWRAIDAGLDNVPQTMLVVDGIDALEGGEPSALKALDSLYQVCSKHTQIKSIALGQPLSKAAPQQTRTLTIESSMTAGDIKSQVSGIIASAPQFRNLKSTDKDRIIQRISTSAEGSFVWADYSMELLRREKTISGMLQVLDSLPKTLVETLKRLQSTIDMKATDTRSLLAWLLAAQRPLTLDEIKNFFEIDLGACQHKPRFSEVEQDVRQSVGPIVNINSGVVRFKHESIRNHFMNLAGSVKDYSNTGDFPFMIKEAHYDLATRCLAYVKLFVTRRVDPVFGRPSIDTLGDLFASYPAFEYTSTYWMSHFYQSPMYDSNGKHKLVPEFRTCFPDSVLLAQIEGSVWPEFAIDWYELSLYIRQNIVGQETLSVLQTLIHTARTLQRTNNYQKASTYYIQAYNLTRTLLSDHDTVLIQIAMEYLTTSGSITITEKNDVATQREDMLKRVIQVYKTERGASNTVTIKYTRMLAQLYTDTKQFDLAVDIWEELYHVMVERYGTHHSETTTIYKTLETVISKSTRKQEISKITQSRAESTTRDLSVQDTRRTTAERDMIKQYTESKDYDKAEGVLVDQWRQVSEDAAKTRDASTFKRKIDLTIQYVQFLKQQNRHEEAKSIMEGVYVESSNRDIQSQTLATSMQSFAEEMKSMSMLKTARSLFTSLSSYYQKSGQTTSSQASSISRDLEQTNEQITQETLTSSTSTASTNSETQLTEMFESLTTMSSSTSSVRFSSIIRTAQQLSIYYIRQQQWTEAYRVASQALSIMWPYFITRQGTVRLPSEFQRECVELALRMGECTWAQRQIDNTEDIYVTVFKATRSTVKLSDDLYSLTAQTLTDFYDQTYQFRKYIDTQKLIYDDQKNQLGATNNTTIQTCYSIAKYCTKQGKYKEAEPWYYDVYTVMVKGDDVPQDAIPAVEALLTVYYDDARYDQLEKISKAIWTTWTKKGTEARFSTEVVQKTYESYSYILKEVRKVAYQEIYQLSKTYYETSRKVYGERNELTLKATLDFAQVCEQSEEHRKESLQIYETACKHGESLRSTSTTTTTSRLLQTVNLARSSLARVYSKQASTASSESASKFMSDEYQASRSSYGSTDTRSLSSLSQLIEYNSKQNSTELTQQSVRMLQQSVVETITQQKDTQTLIQSASTLATSYKQINQTETAWSILREIRRQVITGNYKSEKFNFSIEGTDRSVFHPSTSDHLLTHPSRAYVFIIAFGQSLRGVSPTDNFSELMADLMSETLLYQAYQRAITQKSKFDVVFTSGAKLAIFYQSRQRGEEYNRTWNELFEIFATQMSAANKQSAVLREFFTLVLGEIFENRYDSQIPQLTAEKIHEKMTASKFAEAYELALYLDKYTHLQGGWRSNSKVESGFQIVLTLSGRTGTPKITDQKIASQTTEITRTILSEVLRAARDLNIRFVSMPMKQLNDIVALLGEQQNYSDLDWLLTELWESREQQSSWDSITIVWIGRRLVETRFAAGRREAAITLCEDICYNVRRVWGASDQVTVEMYNLLASLYTAAGDHVRAMSTHEEVCRQTLTAVEEDGDIEPAQGADVVKDQVELMKRSYQRAGGFGDKDGALVKELFGQLTASFGKEKSFASVQGVDKWSTKEKADNLGVWTKPASFEFMGIQDQKHKNNLRRVSGLMYSSPRTANKSGYSSYSYSSSTTNGAVNGQ